MGVEPVAGTFPRRAFFVTAGSFLAGVVGLPILIDRLAAPAAAPAPGPVGGIDVGPLAAFPSAQYTVATFTADPAAGAVSRRVAYIRNNGVRRGGPSFTILSSRCTHVGCPTQPNGPLFPERGSVAHTRGGDVTVVPALPAGFGCPCHGSQFDLEGNHVAGPAPRPLDRYAFSILDGRLLLGQAYSVGRVEGSGADARILAFPLRDPGQPVDGAEAFLYPFQTKETS